MRILHVADLHLRPLDRHDEYRESFEDLFASANKLKPDCIVICGDIVHEKNQRITPEVIDLMNWMFRKFSSIAPVHLILGNHDLNLANLSRKDVLSPILALLDDPNIHFHKDSGKYRFSYDGLDVNFCVFSCIDQDRWKDVEVDKSELNIALFHGTVTGAKTDQDYPLGAEVPLEYFDEFDYVLLGDVHKGPQFLNKKKTIAYPGSTIQQNYGEDPVKGFLFWDIRSKKDFEVTFHKVKNVKPFITINWNGSLKDTVNSIKDITKGSRIRIRSNENLSHVDKSHLETELKGNFNINDIVYDTESYANVRLQEKALKAKKLNLRDTKTLNNLLREFYIEDTFNDDEWIYVEKMISKWSKKISPDAVIRNTEWSLRRLEFDNLFKYKDGNIIDFDKACGISGVFAPNRSGKSSIIGAIVYTLFNTTDRGSIKNQNIINVRKMSARSKLDFTVSGQDYSVERSTKNKQGRKGINTTNSLSFLKGGTDVKTDIKRQDTEKEIRKIIGSPEDFFITAVAASDEMNTFIKKKNTARKAVFSRFLELDVFEELHEIIKEESKFIGKQFKAMSSKDWDKLIEEALNERKEKEKTINNLGEKLSKLHERIELYKRDLESLSGSRDVVTPHDVNEQKKYIQKMEKNLLNIIENIHLWESEVEGAEKDLKRINKIEKTFSVDEYKKKLETIQIIRSSYHNLKQMLATASQVLIQQEKSVKKLDLVPCGDSFPTCKFIKDSHEDKNKIVEQRNKVKELTLKIKELENQISEKEEKEIKDKLEKFEKLIRTGLKLDSTIQRLKGQIKSAEKDQTIAQEKLDLAKNKLKEMEEVVVEVTDDRHSKLISTINDLSKEKKSLDSERISAASSLGQTDQMIKTFEKEKSEYERLRKQWSIYEKLIFAFSKKGIPSQIIQARMPEINDEVEKIISGVAPFKIVLDLNEDTNELEILMNDGGDTYPIELCSGMEKKVAAIAIRVALMNISSLPKPDMLFIDEAFDTFDEKNVDLVSHMFIALKKWFKNVIIISHNEQVKSIADNLIQIESVGKDSFIKYI